MRFELVCHKSRKLVFGPKHVEEVKMIRTKVKEDTLAMIDSPCSGVAGQVSIATTRIA